MKKVRHPDWPIKLLDRFCPPKLVEAILGDLIEQFDEEVETKGFRKAKRRFVFGALRFLHPRLLLRNKRTIPMTNLSIFKSHLKVALRSTLKHRFYTGINLLGLSLSIAFVFLSFLFIRNEMSFDTFHENSADIYRVYTYQKDLETDERIDGSLDGVTAVPVSLALKRDSPVIEYATRFGSSSGTVTVNEVPYDETITMVDQDFLEMFSFPVIQGNTFEALENPNSLILSQAMSEKLFGSNNPIGSSLDVTLNDSIRTFTVAAVLDNMEANSSIPFDFIVPFETMRMLVPDRYMHSFNVSFVETWVLIDQPVTMSLESAFADIINQGEERDEESLEVGLQPLSKVHFDHVITGLASYTNPQKLWSMVALVLLVMVIAVINFVMLTTGHSFNRIKEIGLRKTLGTFRSILRVQLIFESFLFTLFAAGLGVLISYFLLPSFNQLIDATIPGIFSFNNILFILLIAAFLGLICGISQAALLVRLTPMDALKGTNALSSKRSWLNQGLIVLQFSISILLVIGTITIRSQMKFVQQKDLGFDKERLIEISMQDPENTEEARRLYQRFKDEATKNPDVIMVGASMNNFHEPWTELHFRQDDESIEKLYFNQIEENYLEAMGIELVSGETFSNKIPESTSILVNERLVEHFGWEDPIGKQLPGKNFSEPHTVVGVVKDFHFSSLHNEIEPIVLAIDQGAISSGVTGLSTYVWPPNLYNLLVRVGPGDLQQSVSYLEASWKKVNGAKAFSYGFVDDELAGQYQEEQRWSDLIDTASIFAIVIAWMGLLGLTRLSVQKRVKEVGIRKVLGSSVQGVMIQLSKRFLVLVGVANIIALPIAWWGASKWLESFVYRIDFNVLLLLAGGLGVLFVAIISVGTQAFKAAVANPSECLRNE